MQITLEHTQGMRFDVHTPKSMFEMDCPSISPIEYFLSGILGCSATDIVMLAQKNETPLRHFRLLGEVQRNESAPRKFNTLHVEYSFESDADDVHATRWVMASLETYCSTINTIREGVAITYTLIHNHKKLKDHEQIISGGGSTIDLGTLTGCPA